MKILEVTDPAFRKYGRVLKGFDLTGLAKVMETAPCPENVVYEPSIAALEAEPIAEKISSVCYGELPIQIGYCNGHNKLLNAVEYHRNSELNICMTEAILIVGMQQDITDDFTYETSKMEAFRVPAMTAVEIYATTLHYAPCQTSDAGFKVIIVLPKGTNYPLADAHTMEGEDKTLAATNKWLIGHAEGGLAEGSHIGLIGENLSV
ncbi:MAG: DUF4867 family protein [Lachnospiraceae bacterium]|nr:DUF4867 family protein [Lachnospiraceae bacterium]